MEITLDELDKQIEQTKGHLKDFLFTTFSYDDKIKKEIDPEIDTWKTGLFQLYEIRSNPNRLSKFLDVVNRYIGDDLDIYQNDKIDSDNKRKLTLFGALLKCGSWLLKNAPEEEFSTFIVKFENQELPASLTSDAEVVRLNEKFMNLIGSENIKLGDKYEMAHQSVGTTGEPAITVLLRDLHAEKPLETALKTISEMN